MLKVRASRASSSSPSTSSRSCSISSGLAAIASVWRVNRAIGASAVRATRIPSNAASAIPPAAISGQQQQLVGERVVDVGQRQRHRQRAALADAR